MMEWKRTIFSGRFLCLLLCIILLNGIFFLKVQFDRNLGLDLSAPESQLSHSVIVTEEGFSQSEKLPQISLNELNKEYLIGICHIAMPGRRGGSRADAPAHFCIPVR